MKISIIIPCYNAEKWIEKCVESALNQDYKNIEVIAVDNESTDNTLKILKNIKHKNFIVDVEKNIYPHCWDEARKKGFSLASGKYLFTLASDDFLDLRYISRCMKYIMAAPDKIMAFQSPIRGVKGDQNVLVEEISHNYRTLSEFKQKSISACSVNSPTVVYNRKLFDEGLLETKPEIYSGAADYDLVCKLADLKIFIYPANKWLGYYYRWHPEQATWDMHKDPKNYDKMIQGFWRKKWSL